MSDETRQDGDGSQAAGEPETTSAASAPEPPPAPAAGPTAGADPGAPAPRRPRRRTLLAVGLVAVIVVTAVGFGVTRVITPDRSCPTPAEHAGLVRRPALGRVAAGRDPARAPEPACPCAQPVPHLGRDVGRVGGVRPDGQRLHLHDQGAGRRRRRGARRGDQLRRLPRALGPVHQGGRRCRLARRVRGRHGRPVLPGDGQRRPRATRPPRSATGSRPPSSPMAWTDGSNQANGYAAPDYTPVNDPLVVNKPGTTMKDPNRWQPLQLEKMISQNGIPVENGVQQAVGPHWGHVLGFGIPDGGVGRRADRSRAAAAAGRDAGAGPGVQGPGGGDHPPEQPARCRVRRDDRHLAGVVRRQHAGHQRRHGPPGQPGDRPAVRSRTSSRSATSPAR